MFLSICQFFRCKKHVCKCLHRFADYLGTGFSEGGFIAKSVRNGDDVHAGVFARDDIDFEVAEHLIVELYSK